MNEKRISPLVSNNNAWLPAFSAQHQRQQQRQQEQQQHKRVQHLQQNHSGIFLEKIETLTIKQDGRVLFSTVKYSFLSLN